MRLAVPVVYWRAVGPTKSSKGEHDVDELDAGWGTDEDDNVDALDDGWGESGEASLRDDASAPGERDAQRDQPRGARESLAARVEARKTRARAAALEKQVRRKVRADAADAKRKRKQKKRGRGEQRAGPVSQTEAQVGSPVPQSEPPSSSDDARIAKRGTSRTTMTMVVVAGVAAAIAAVLVTK